MMDDKNNELETEKVLDDAKAPVTDEETAAAAIITGSFNAQVKDSLDEIKDFYFCGGLSA
jgi:hypothetical protein